MNTLEYFFNKTMDDLSLAVFIVDTNCNVILWNRACEQLTKIKSKDVIGTKDHWRAFYPTKRPCLVDFIIKGNHDEIIQYYSPSLIRSSPAGYKYEGWMTNSENELKYVIVEAISLYNERNEVVGAITIMNDVTQYKNINDKLKMSYDVFDDISDGVIITDESNRIIFANRAVEEMSDYSKDELLGNTPAIFSLKNQERNFVKEIWKALDDKGYWSGEFVNAKKDNTPFHVRYNITRFKAETGEVNHIALLANITEQKEIIEQLNARAYYDHLTQLPNRSLLEQRIKELIEKERNDKSKFAVLFLDLNKFKKVNDTLGHDIGDLLLKEIGSRLQAVISPNDMVARLGGDEFVILLESIESSIDLDIVMKKIEQAFMKKFAVKDHMISISASIGGALYPDTAKTINGLLKKADSSMYVNKNGKINSSIHNDDMNKVLKENMSIVDKLPHSIPNNMQVYLQPQYSFKTNKIYGAEALVRWHDPDLGWVSPERFIPLAEDFNFVHHVWDFMLDNACRIIKETGVKIAVNLSASQLQHENLISNIKKFLNKHAINPSLLSFEITETILISNFEVTKDVLEKIHQMNISLGLDDFGTGYSSLSYLNRLPFDYIKIDRSFVQDPDNKSIAESIIEMAKKLNLTTIAEGIETVDQLIKIKESGCSIVQGYFYSKPIPESEYLKFIAENNSARLLSEIETKITELNTKIEEEVKDKYSFIIKKIERLENSDDENQDLPVNLEDIVELYNSLMDYFLEKEELMVKMNFIDYEKHKERHEEFLSLYLSKIAEVNENNKDPKPLLTFLRRWLTSHSVLISQKIRLSDAD